MENINEQLAEVLGELDHIFQEGVLINKADMLRFDNLLKQLKNYRKEYEESDSLEGFYLPAIFNH